MQINQQQLATKLALTSGGVEGQVSHSVTMSGANAAQAEVTLITLLGTSPVIRFQLQVSNDLENWSDTGSNDDKTAAGSYVLPVKTSIGSSYVRLKYSINSGTSVDAIIAATLATSDQ